MRPGWREVERHVRMQLEPTVVLGFVGIQVVEHDVDGGVRPNGDNVVHALRNSMRRRRFLCAAVTLPVATSKAANSVEVPLRL